MITQTTIKAIKQSYNKVFSCGYCDLCNILNNESPKFYNYGIYGWNCDIYTNDNLDIAITTGYRNTKGKRIPSEIIKKYDKKARAILENWETPYKTKRDKLEKIASKFWQEISTL